MKQTGIILALVALFPGAAAAQSNCDALQALVKQAPDGFAGYVAGPAAPQSFDASMDRRPANVSWGNAICTVSSNDSILRCSWDDASFAGTVAQAAACLPGAGKVAASGETYFTLPVSHVIVTVSGSGASGGEVLMEIRGP
jgi:hypothetical protein